MRDKGAPGIPIVTVHPVGYGYGSRFSLSELEISKKCYDISKLEMVCDDEDLVTFVEVILNSAHTGASGDGLILVSDVREAIKIKTRKRGTQIAVLSR